MTEIIRCPWCGDDPLYVRYHDEEWGSPVHRDDTLFEFITLEWAQAGLSWITVLRKRENYRLHFHDWNIEKISKMTDDELEKILLDPGVVRNRLKIYSVRKNAQISLEIQKEFGSLDAYFWGFSWLGHVDERRHLALEHSKQDFSSSKDTGLTRNDRNTQTFPIVNHPESMNDLVAESDNSRVISKDLKKRGMSFVGSTIIYAFMQATGMVDDHIDSCFRKKR